MRRSSRFKLVLANAVTCGNFASGVAAILRREEGRPVFRSALILAGIFCDSLDGTIARRSGNATVPGAACCRSDQRLQESQVRSLFRSVWEPDKLVWDRDVPQNVLKDTADVRVRGDAVNNKCASW